MGWLLGGILYSSIYAVLGWSLRGYPALLSWFRAVALLVPPLTGAVVIVRRRQTWRGCQWLFWATIAVGLAMSAAGLTGWAASHRSSRCSPSLTGEAASRWRRRPQSTSPV